MVAVFARVLVSRRESSLAVSESSRVELLTLIVDVELGSSGRYNRGCEIDRAVMMSVVETVDRM